MDYIGSDKTHDYYLDVVHGVYGIYVRDVWTNENGEVKSGLFYEYNLYNITEEVRSILTSGFMSALSSSLVTVQKSSFRLLKMVLIDPVEEAKPIRTIKYPTVQDRSDGIVLSDECKYCDSALTVDSCVANRTIEYPDGPVIPSIVSDFNCINCGIKVGGIHHPGCVNEMCPRCLELLNLDCNCFNYCMEEYK